MWRLTVLLQIAASGAFAAACGGLVATLLVAFEIGGLGGMILGLVMVPIGIIEGIRLAAVPATLLGGLLWAAGPYLTWPRSSLVWASVGAVAGLAVYYFTWPTYQSVRQSGEITFPHPAAAMAICFAAGVIAALAFRHSMKFLALFGPEPPA
jgi:hypothetical protein